MHDIRPYFSEPFTQPGSLLYIGARPDAHSWLDELAEAGNSINILEIWEDNVIGLTRAGYGNKASINIGDVRKVDEIYIQKFDYIFWWHGPEHVFLDEIYTTLERLEARARRLVAVACPWGLYPQGAHKGNPHEEHKTTLYPESFTKLGYEVATDGRENEAGSEIVAWKRLPG